MDHLKRPQPRVPGHGLHRRPRNPDRTVKTGKGGRKEPTKDRKTEKKNKVKWSRGGRN